MTAPDHITRDIARNCAADIAAVIEFHTKSVITADAKLAISMSAAANAVGTASGCYLAYHDLQRSEPIYPAAAAKGLWRSLEPMVIRAMTAIRDLNGDGHGPQTILPNPFPLVDVTDADRDALYGGLVAAGHPSEFANHMAYDMADDDGGLQMLARHRLAFSTPSLDRDYTRDRIGELLRECDGFWRACSGCQESVDGCVSTTDYPYSPLFRCQPGSGCSECGGIGVLWDDGRGYADVDWQAEAPATSDGALWLQAVWDSLPTLPAITFSESEATAILAAIESAEDAADRAGNAVPAGEVEPCSFADCPPGLFRWNGLLCFKSEYSTKAGQPDAYCVDSGEYFWGGTSGDLEKRRNLIVKPVAFASPSHGEGRT